MRIEQTRRKLAGSRITDMSLRAMGVTIDCSDPEVLADFGRKRSVSPTKREMEDRTSLCLVRTLTEESIT